MVKGTNNSDKYEASLMAIMSYLGKHYNVAYANVLGYSAGGGGVYHYLIDHGYDRSLPPIKKFVSLMVSTMLVRHSLTKRLHKFLLTDPKLKQNIMIFG